MLQKVVKNLAKGLLILGLVLGQFTSLGIKPAGATGTAPELISKGVAGQNSNGNSEDLSISNDGRYVAFRSNATNLVSDITDANTSPAYIRDRVANTTSIASVNSEGEQQNGTLMSVLVSGNGRYVFFAEYGATNMGLDPSFIHPGYGDSYLFRHDLVTNDTELVSIDDSGDPDIIDQPTFLTVSDDGNMIVYNNAMRNIATQTNYVISGAEIKSISGSGNRINYTVPTNGSYSGNAIYTRNLNTNQDTLVYEGAVDTTPESSSVRGNDEYVFFNTPSAAIVPGVSGICAYAGCAYRFSLDTLQTIVLKTTMSGENFYFLTYSLSADGEFAAVTRGVKAVGDSYEIIDMEPTGILYVNIDTTNGYPVGLAANGSQPTSPAANSRESRNVKLNADGSEVVFLSSASNFGVPVNCTINVEGSLYPGQCIDVYVSTTDQPQSPEDLLAPVLSLPSWSQNPKPTTGSSTLTIPATDDISGIVHAEYFIGDDDPGEGNGVAMQISDATGGGLSANLTTAFGTNFPTGVYKISARAQDSANNWSQPVSDYLVVYNPSGPKMTGKRTVVPSYASGDVLPGLASSSQTDKAKFGFSIKYNNQGQINSNSDFMFSYSTGTKCNSPAKAANCHELNLNSTSLEWFTTQNNNSTGIFQGTAGMVVDGQSSLVTFRVTGIDGEQLNSVANDKFQLLVYPHSTNPNTTLPIYQVNITDIARGNIKITN